MRKSLARRSASSGVTAVGRRPPREPDSPTGSQPPTPTTRSCVETPNPGDFVVLYTDRDGFPTPTVQLQRVQKDARPWLIRATFESADDAGPRFEAVARALAESARSRAWRCCLHTGLISLLGSYT